MKELYEYRCEKCDKMFDSHQTKMDVVCIHCGALEVDYAFKSKSKKEPMTTNKEEPILPAQAGYYKALVAKKYEENTGLKEQRGWLLEQVYFLRKAVKFLETRKKELEDGIYGLEKNITIGISIMEQLEENKEFQQLSEKTAKVNK